MYSLKFVAMINRHGPEIIQFYGENKFDSLRISSMENFIHSQ